MPTVRFRWLVRSIPPLPPPQRTTDKPSAVKKYLSLPLLAFAVALVTSSAPTLRENALPDEWLSAAREQAWVDSVFHSLSLEAKIGQLFWLRVHTDKDKAHEDAVEKMVRRFQPGGLCFFNPTGKGTPEKQVELTNRYQSVTSTLPMFISVDGEWGLGMRMKGTALSFPRQLTLGAIQDDFLIYEMGAAIARHCRRVGVNVNFAPVADVNNNAVNPVIGFRSFGEIPRRVARKALQYMNGMQDNGLLASAKHFPGHGDTDTDSHYDLPVIRHSRDRLDSVELMPFRTLIRNGVGSVMIAHLQVPALDPAPNLPTTLSRRVVTDLLRNELNFDGLILTDALEMKAVSKFHTAGEVEAKALAAGADVLLLPADVENAYSTVSEWLADGRLDTAQVFLSVRRLLHWKYRLGLTSFSPLPIENTRADVNDLPAQALKRTLFQHALTLVRNRNSLLPMNPAAAGKTAALAIGADKDNPFHLSLSRFTDMPLFATSRDLNATQWLETLAPFDTVVVSLHQMSQFASKRFGLSSQTIDLVRQLSKIKEVILVVHGNPYALPELDSPAAILVAYEDDPVAADISAQALFGTFPVTGRLPVSASPAFPAGTGVQLDNNQRLGFGLPEEVGLRSSRLRRIDTLVRQAIREKAIPGAVVLIAKNGKIVFQQAWGHHDYLPSSPRTSVSDVWDLASITKIAATTVSLMLLQDQGLFDPRLPVESYLPEFANSNKAGIPVTDMLTHHAGLTPWIKFYEKTLDHRQQPSPSFYRDKPSASFPSPVAKDRWLAAGYRDTIWKEIIESPLLGHHRYTYSDLGFYVGGEIVSRLSDTPLDLYACQSFYQPMGLRSIGFKPLEKFSPAQIPPTEEDRYFRHRRIQGFVHDMGAAMLDQVSGHAGLFSNAADLAAVMQMLLNKGFYAGTQFLQPQTVQYYTSRCSDCTRRGLGFDLRQLDDHFDPNLSNKASIRTFGHLGFTGTAAWADPDHQLVYVFLSNRTYPSMKNNSLGSLNTRILVQDAIYDALDPNPPAFTR
ncbi:MAG: hypothetical protein RLY31_471 [Bacteroidota bacterium]